MKEGIYVEQTKLDLLSLFVDENSFTKLEFSAREYWSDFTGEYSMK